ncbi:MAG: hypothetical protein AAGL24_04025 [Pseudomonadota bacterium]
MDLDGRAVAILQENDRGGFTIPTRRLYPFQWNWDSAFCALGFATFDRDRAWREIETLFEGQWADGMVPHIIFRRDDPDYFPGPAVWRTPSEPPTSGYSQPPVVASILRLLMRDGHADDTQRAGALFDKTLAWHRWFHTYRDPFRRGVIGLAHPWESGRDNSPDWDESLRAVVVAPDLEPYVRRDLDHVDASERPHKDEYDRYLTIVSFGRNAAWDADTIARRGPFLVADPGLTFILLRADRDLLALARHLGRNDAIGEIEAWIAAAEAGADYLWNEAAHGYCARNMHDEVFSPALTNASMLAFYAGVGSPAQRTRLAAEARRISDTVPFLMPSWDPARSEFEPRRYWRGPIWCVMNFMIAAGFREAGEDALADRVRQDTARLIEKAGFYENFDPTTGNGCGGADFSWTAAIWLAWASPTQVAAAA